MVISRLDLMRAAEALDGECDFEDMSEEELEEMLGARPEGAAPEEAKERYFSFHDDVKDKSRPVRSWSD